MTAGELRNRVFIERPFTTTDALGAPQKSWQNLGTVQAQIAFVSGREYFGARDADVAEATVRITLREIPDADLDPNCKITDIDTGAVYDVVSVLPSLHRNRITVAAKSGSKHP